MLPEAVLHISELVDAIHALGFLLRVDEAGKRELEVLSAGTVRHSAQTGTVPVDLARFRIVSRLTVVFPFSFLGLGRGWIGSGEGGGYSGDESGSLGGRIVRLWLLGPIMSSRGELLELRRVGVSGDSIWESKDEGGRAE